MFDLDFRVGTLLFNIYEIYEQFLNSAARRTNFTRYLATGIIWSYARALRFPIIVASLFPGFTSEKHPPFSSKNGLFHPGIRG